MDMAELLKEAGLMSQKDVDECRAEKHAEEKKQEDFYNQKALEQVGLRQKPKELTDEQINNWRKALSMTLGPYAFVMPREEIIQLRCIMQVKLDNYHI